MKRNNWLKSIILGTKDYIKDCWHDWLYHRLSKTHTNATIYFLNLGCDIKETTWKEGSIWHYIRQRRLAGKYKLWSIDGEINTIEDLWQFMQSVVEDMPKIMTPDDYKFMITACKDIIRIAKKKGWGK